MKRTLRSIALALVLLTSAAVAAQQESTTGRRPAPQAPTGPEHEVSSDEAAKMTRREAKRLLRSLTVERDGRRSTREADDVEADALLRDLRREGPIAIPEQLIGEDTRSEIVNSSERPYRNLAHILIGCSGAMVGPRHVLTAVHCIYDLQTGDFYDDLDVQPGRDDDNIRFGTIGWTSVTVPTGWVERGLLELDYGIIELESDVGERTGLLRYGPRPVSSSSRVKILGYPAEKAYGSLWRSTCRLLAVTNTQFYYPCDTTAGTSGAPVLLDGRIVAVHTYSALGQEFNFGTRISEGVASTITRWIRH